MLSALIQSDEGVNAVWVFLKSLEQAMQTLSSKEANDVADLRDSLSGANDYTDKAVNKLYTYVDAMNGGVGGLIDSTSYDPSGLPTDKPCTLIALGSGTFTNLKDVNNTAITVSQSNSITVFFRAAHVTYWNYKTEVLTAPPMDDTPTNGNTTHVVSSDGVYDFVMVHGIDNVDVADVTDSAYLKDHIIYSMRKNIGTESEPEYETIASFTIPVATATKAGLMPAYVDGVFDVNRYVGSDTPYDSLSQVLNNAATLIPTAVRRGGMSIKFIQSSDNKYVQYRLMSTYWSITEIDWQGVDDKLAEDSKNLPQSGGVYRELYGVHVNAFASLSLGSNKKSYAFNTPIASGTIFKIVIRNGSAVYNAAPRFALINDKLPKRIITGFENNHVYEITADTTINSIAFYWDDVTTAGTFIASFILVDGLADQICFNTLNDENYRESMEFLKRDFFKSIDEKIKGSSVSGSSGMENIVKQNNHLTLNTNNHVAQLTTSAGLVAGRKYVLYYKIECSRVGAGSFSVQFRSIGGSWQKTLYTLYGITDVAVEGSQIFTIEGGEGGTLALNMTGQIGLSFIGDIFMYDVTGLSDDQVNSVDFSKAGNGEHVFFNKFAKKCFNITELWENKMVVFYGDSITAGQYPEMVRSALGFVLAKRALDGTGFTYQDENSFSADTRIATIPAAADYVCIMGGTNDWGRSTVEQVLEYNNGFDRTLFKGAVAYTITKIQERCPNAQIFILTNIGGRGDEDPSVIQPLPEVSGTTGNTALTIRNATIEVANILNIPVIDTWSCGINGFNRHLYIKDAVHPTYLGHQMIANYIIKKLIEKRSW